MIPQDKEEDLLPRPKLSVKKCEIIDKIPAEKVVHWHINMCPT
jgi:hypothetical protein